MPQEEASKVMAHCKFRMLCHCKQKKNIFSTKSNTETFFFFKKWITKWAYIIRVKLCVSNTKCVFLIVAFHFVLVASWRHISGHFVWRDEVWGGWFLTSGSSTSVTTRPGCQQERNKEHKNHNCAAGKSNNILHKYICAYIRHPYYTG